MFFNANRAVASTMNNLQVRLAVLQRLNLQSLSHFKKIYLRDRERVTSLGASLNAGEQFDAALTPIERVPLALMIHAAKEQVCNVMLLRDPYNRLDYFCLPHDDTE